VQQDARAGREIYLDGSYWPCLDMVDRYKLCYETYVQDEILSGHIG
jgi:hypothetical protein